MVATFVLVAGVLLVTLIGIIVCTIMGTGQVLVSLMPFIPFLVLIGSFLLIGSEMLLFFGTKEDRRVAKRDLKWLVPLFLVSGGLWYGIQFLQW